MRAYPPLQLLHVTAHLGGGVGKVLSRLVEESERRQDGIKHSIACLEKPEKWHFVEHVRKHGGEVVVSPSLDELTRLAAEADIVQLEWWHHPLVAGWLCSDMLPAMRLVIWSHVSGLHSPVIPPQFVAAPHRFLFTSPCSLEHPALAAFVRHKSAHIDVVFSSGGFEGFPDTPPRQGRGTISAGYVGTLNFAKLHPRFMEFLGAVRLPDFRVALVGDPVTATELLEQAGDMGLAGMLDVRGYCNDIPAELAQFDIFPYLLNPLHYGTTENALLEAMAMGVVPIVLNNPAERHLVCHGETGLVVDSPDSFSEAVVFLANNRHVLTKLSSECMRRTREKFSLGATSDRLMLHYTAVREEAKRVFDFRPVFGAEPAEWFRTCVGDEAWRFSDEPTCEKRARGPHYLYEKTKSSAYHFRTIYPDDVRLQQWCSLLESER